MRMAGFPGRPLRARWSVLATLALLVLTCATEPVSAGPLRAGAATSNITPWLGLTLNGGMQDRTATHVHDELHARAIVLDDGASRLAIIVCDSCMIPRDVVLEAKGRIQEQTGIPPENVLISATHAHSCPTCTGVFQSEPDDQYPRFLATRIADAAARAFNNLEPARIGWGRGQNDQQVFNRRWRMKPGTIPPDPFERTTDKVRMNPPVGSSDLVEPTGPIDPEVPVVSVQSSDGRPIALLANYSLHYVGGTGGGHVSADYFGVFADRVQALLGADRLDPPFVGIMSNGTSGDINNVNFREARPAQPPYAQMRIVAGELAEEAARVLGSIEYHTEVTLAARTRELELGVRRPDGMELSRAREILAEAGDRELRTLPEIYARETVLLDEYPEEVPVTLQALRIGDLAIAAIPCEVFVEIGLEIKRDSPFPMTFTIELANGYNGYLPTEEQHELGGYETWRARSSYLEVGAAGKITDAVVGLLGELNEGTSPGSTR